MPLLLSRCFSHHGEQCSLYLVFYQKRAIINRQCRIVCKDLLILSRFVGTFHYLHKRTHLSLRQSSLLNYTQCAILNKRTYNAQRHFYIQPPMMGSCLKNHGITFQNASQEQISCMLLEEVKCEIINFLGEMLVEKVQNEKLQILSYKTVRIFYLTFPKRKQSWSFRRALNSMRRALQISLRISAKYQRSN